MSSDKDTFDQTISRNITASLLSNILYLATRLCIPPFILSYVSLAEYGLWAYCFILLGYLGMSVFGITNVYVRYAAVYVAKGDIQSVNRLISTGVFTVAGLCLLILPLVWFGLPAFFSLFHITEEYKHTAFVLLFGTTIIFMSDLTIGVFGYILQSLQKIVTEKTIWTISYLLETFFIVFLLLQGYGIYSLLWAFAVRTATATILYAIACKKYLPSLSLNPKLYDKNMLKLFYNFGGIVQLSGLIGILNRSIEKVMAGLFLGLEATGLYEVGEKFPVMSLMLPGSVNAVYLPTASHFHANEDSESIRSIYLNGSRLINLITGMMMGFMMAFATPLIFIWLGNKPEYALAANILIWFTIPYQMDVVTGPASAIYRSIGEPSRELFYSVSQLVLVVVLACFTFYWWGASILTINFTVASMMILSSILYLFKSNRFLKVSHYDFIKNVLVPGFIPYVFAFCIALLASSTLHEHSNDRWTSLYIFILCLAIYLALCCPFIYFFICTHKERSDIRRAVGL